MPSITLRNVHKFYNDYEALKGVSFSVEKGSFVSVIGESGSGKTTLLKVIAGLINIDYGEIYFDDEIVNHRYTKDRNVGYVFQECNLYPNMTVLENTLFPIKKSKLDYEKKIFLARKVLEKLNILELESAFPKELSYGERQKVAIAKTLIKEPDIILFDEPFSNIDPIKKAIYRNIIIELKKVLKDTTFFFVTHDINDVLNFDSTVLVMNDGQVLDYSNSNILFNHPSSLETKNIIFSNSEDLVSLSPYLDFNCVIQSEDLIIENMYKIDAKPFLDGLVDDKTEVVLRLKRRCIINHSKENTFKLVALSSGQSKLLYKYKIFSKDYNLDFNYDELYYSYDDIEILDNNNEGILSHYEISKNIPTYKIIDSDKNICLISGKHIKIDRPLDNLSFKISDFEISTSRKNSFKVKEIVNIENFKSFYLLHMYVSGFENYVSIKLPIEVDLSKKIKYIKIRG